MAGTAEVERRAMVVGGGGVTRAAARRDNDGVRKSESGMGPGDSAESMLRSDEPEAFDSVTTLSGPNARCGGLFFSPYSHPLTLLFFV